MFRDFPLLPGHDCRGACWVGLYACASLTRGDEWQGRSGRVGGRPQGASLLSSCLGQVSVPLATSVSWTYLQNASQPTTTATLSGSVTEDLLTRWLPGQRWDWRSGIRGPVCTGVASLITVLSPRRGWRGSFSLCSELSLLPHACRSSGVPGKGKKKKRRSHSYFFWAHRYEISSRRKGGLH